MEAKRQMGKGYIAVTHRICAGEAYDPSEHSNDSAQRSMCARIPQSVSQLLRKTQNKTSDPPDYLDKERQISRDTTGPVK